MTSIRDNLFQMSQEKPPATGMSLGRRRHTSSSSSTKNATFQQKKKRGGLPHRNYGQWRKTVNAITDDSGDDYSSDLEHLEFSSIEKDRGDDHDDQYASLDIMHKRPASLVKSKG